MSAHYHTCLDCPTEIALLGLMKRMSENAGRQWRCNGRTRQAAVKTLGTLVVGTHKSMLIFPFRAIIARSGTSTIKLRPSLGSGEGLVVRCWPTASMLTPPRRDKLHRFELLKLVTLSGACDARTACNRICRADHTPQLNSLRAKTCMIYATHGRWEAMVWHPPRM